MAPFLLTLVISDRISGDSWRCPETPAGNVDNWQLGGFVVLDGGGLKELPPVRKRVTIVNAGKTYVGVYSVKGDLLAVRSGTALRTAVVSKRRASEEEIAKELLCIMVIQGFGVEDT